MTLDGKTKLGKIALEELIPHMHHQIAVVSYGDEKDNVAVECEDCNVVLLDVSPLS